MAVLGLLEFRGYDDGLLMGRWWVEDGHIFRLCSVLLESCASLMNLLDSHLLHPFLLAIRVVHPDTNSLLNPRMLHHSDLAYIGRLFLMQLFL